MTLRGQVETGAEAACLMLRSDGHVYQLMGGDQNILKPENTVIVRGRVVTGVMSHCMQGQPFQVADARLG
jgi:hypothetical protein